MEEQTVIEDVHPDVIEAREKAAAEEMLREIEASLGHGKKNKKIRGIKNERALLNKRGRPRGSKNTKPRTQKDPLAKQMFRKPKTERSPKKKTRNTIDENTIVFQHVPQQIIGEQHTIMTTNGQQIQIQTGQGQQFFTVPRMMSPQQQTMTNINNDQNLALNQTNLMAFVQNNQNRAVEDNMRNMATAQAQVC